MCLSNPEKMAGAGLGLGAAGLGMQTVGAYNQTKAANKAAKYNAALYGQNAAFADAQADDALARGEESAARAGQQISAFKGKQVAGFAAGGVDVTQGSVIDVLEDTDALGHQDLATIMGNAGREAQGYRMEAANNRAKARLTKAGVSSPWLTTGTTLLTGASPLAMQYAGWKNQYGKPKTKLSDVMSQKEKNALDAFASRGGGGGW